MAREVKEKPRMNPQFAKTVMEEHPYGQEHGAGDKGAASQGDDRDCTNCGATTRDASLDYCPQCGTKLPPVGSSTSAAPAIHPIMNPTFAGTMMGPPPAVTEPKVEETTPTAAEPMPAPAPPSEGVLPEPTIPAMLDVPEPVPPTPPVTADTGGPRPPVASFPSDAVVPSGFPASPVASVQAAAPNEKVVTVLGFEFRWWGPWGKGKPKKPPVLDPALGYTEMAFVQQNKLPLGILVALAIFLVAVVTLGILSYLDP